MTNTRLSAFLLVVLLRCICRGRTHQPRVFLGVMPCVARAAPGAAKLATRLRMSRMVVLIMACCSCASAFFGAQPLSQGLTMGELDRRRLVAGAVSVEQSEFARAELAKRQREYETAQKERLMQEAAKGAASNAGDRPPSLAELQTIPYLNEQGRVSDSGVTPQVKATAYAVMDEQGEVQYIGVSRNVAQSLRLQLARMPEKTYSFKVHHIARPSKALLEAARQAWIKELGGVPPGNDEGDEQGKWEGPLDVKPLMTAEDHASIVAAREMKRPEENALKKIARRFEEQKVKILESRGVTESLRFDPKLKGKGLLDLYQEGPNASVPETPKAPER